MRIIILLHQVFNPNLIGYSTGTGEFISTNAKLNIAFPVAATEDAFQQARILVQRIKSNPKINVMKQWKVLILWDMCFTIIRNARWIIGMYVYELQLITIFFGANDICSAQCFNPEQFSPLRYAHHLRRTLDYLKFVLPRTLVNVVPAIGNIWRIETLEKDIYALFVYLMNIRFEH